MFYNSIFFSKINAQFKNFEVSDTIDQRADELSYASFPCEHCEYIASRGDNLKKHIEAKHLGVTYVTCVPINQHSRSKIWKDNTS